MLSVATCKRATTVNHEDTKATKVFLYRNRLRVLRDFVMHKRLEPAMAL